MERKAAEEAQAQAEAGNQQIPAEAAQPQQSVEDIIKFERHRADIQQQQEKHELSMNLKIQEATMKRQIEEIKAASAINRLA
jgi:hypothetical protein